MSIHSPDAQHIQVQSYIGKTEGSHAKNHSSNRPSLLFIAWATLILVHSYPIELAIIMFILLKLEQMKEEHVTLTNLYNSIY